MTREVNQNEEKIEEEKVSSLFRNVSEKIPNCAILKNTKKSEKLRAQKTYDSTQNFMSNSNNDKNQQNIFVIDMDILNQNVDQKKSPKPRFKSSS